MEVKDAIMKEMFIHNTQRKVEEIISNRCNISKTNFDKDKIDLMIYYTQNPSEIDIGQKPDEVHFQNMWSGVDKYNK